MMTGILCLILAYLVGSVPSGLVIGKVLYHTDPREYGSHNTGATNAYRVFGAVGGLLVLICDVAKGMFGVYLGQLASQAGIGTPAGCSLTDMASLPCCLYTDTRRRSALENE